jgi:DNA helicase IV
MVTHSIRLVREPRGPTQRHILPAAQAKGLEFDSLLVAEPAQIITGVPRGLNDLA